MKEQGFVRYYLRQLKPERRRNETDESAVAGSRFIQRKDVTG
jgi:hypothetical protein